MKESTRIVQLELVVKNETLQDFNNQNIKSDYDILQEFKDFYFSFNNGKRQKEREDFYLSIKDKSTSPDVRS